jgi:GT2 family glycosyltransferase
MGKPNKKLTSSVIICTKDRQQDLLECVDSIKAQTILPKELVIVDAGQQNGIETELKEKLRGTPVQLKYLRTQPGLTYQRNIGVKNSNGDIVLFLDDDVILNKDYFENIMKVYSSNQDENLGGVGGKIVNLKPTPLHWHIFNRLFLLHRHGALLPTHTPFFDEVTQVRVLSGCNMSYKREVFSEFEFDENLPGYALMEDVDFSSRVSQRHYLVMTPQAKLLHKESPISRDRISKYIQMQNYNSFYLFMKNCPKTPKNVLLFVWSRIGMFLGGVLRFLLTGNLAWVTGFFKSHNLIFKEILGKNSMNNTDSTSNTVPQSEQIFTNRLGFRKGVSNNRRYLNQKLSVVIPTKNRKDDLFETLDSVFKQNVLPYEIIIIDQSDKKANYVSMRSLARDKNIKFKVIYDPKIKGLTQARNIGLDNIRGDIVLFLDDDLILDKNYIKNIFETFSEPDSADIAGVGGIVELQEEKRGLKFNSFFKLGPFADIREKIKDKPSGIYETQYLSGGSMSLKKKDIGNLRFDENMTGYSHGEDMDFCFRLSKKSRLVLNSRAVCLHKKSPVGRYEGKRMTNDILFHYYFFKKNLPANLKNLATYLWFNLGMLVRPLFRFQPRMYRDVFRGYWKIGKFVFRKKLEWE